MAPISLLLVDDEQEFTEVMTKRLNKRGFVVTTATDGEGALRHLQDNIDIVILDVAMPGMSGIDILKAIKKERPIVEVIMLTGHGTVGTAVDAIKMGAFNYLIKPCEIEDLVVQIDKALARRRDREAKILEVRMMPYLAPQKREEMIAAILEH
jgi:DNA-binding NtrC family response regulator